MNKVILMGRVAKKESKKVGKEHIVCNVSIAMNNLKGEAEFYDVVLWDRKADFVEKYIEKGKRVLIEGYLTKENYTDKDGKNHSITKIIGTNIEFADAKTENKDELPFG